MTALQDIDSSLRAKIDAELCENVLDPIARALASIDVMKADMRVRELSKLDYDSRARKVRELKEKPGSDHKKVAHKEDKLNRTRQTLADLTSALFERMDEFEGNRCSVYGPIMNAYLNAQRKFFSSASAAMTAIPDFPVTDAGRAAMTLTYICTCAYICTYALTNIYMRVQKRDIHRFRITVEPRQPNIISARVYANICNFNTCIHPWPICPCLHVFTSNCSEERRARS